jgi:thioredoxin 1
MKGRSINILISTILVILFAQAVMAADGWNSDWKKALELSKTEKRPIFIDFYTDWCPPCKKLSATTLVDKKMLDYFKKENYILVKINPEKDRAAESKFKVYSYPTLVVFNNNTQEIDRLLGYKTTEQLIKNLEDLKKGIGTLDDLLNQLKKQDGKKSKKTFELMFGIMDKYIARADYPDALKMVKTVVSMDKENGMGNASAALYQKGYIYYKWKKFQKAVDSMLEIQKIYPDSQEAENGYGAAAYYSEKMDNLKQAIKIMKEFLQKYPQTKSKPQVEKRIKKLEKKINGAH